MESPTKTKTTIIPEGSIKPDESKSNHAVQAFSYEKCPMNPQQACFGIATGFGGAVIPCEYFSDDGKVARCSYSKKGEYNDE